MASKRGSMMLPRSGQYRPSSERLTNSCSDFILTDDIHALSEGVQTASGPISAVENETAVVTTVPASEDTIQDMTAISNDYASHDQSDQQRLGDLDSRVDSRYYSIVSDRTSVRTFFTTRSRQTAYSRDSRVSTTTESTPWQQTLFARQLLPEFDETNWSGLGQHVEFGPNEQPVIDDLLHHLGVLGHSATALVDKVRCKRITLARKRIQCSYKIKREEMIEEVAHLKRLTHAHIVRGVGTYVIKKELSILLYPATAYNLQTFMEDIIGQQGQQHGIGLLPEENLSLHWKTTATRQFLKCLASTMAFVHSKFIKHMDIKPTNFLVEQRSALDYRGGVIPGRIRYKVYLADFGISRSYNTAAEVETDSFTAFTRIYAAPEVIRQDRRGFPADIFSLGCVFLEMLTCLTAGRQALLDVRKQNSDHDMSYQANLPAITRLKLENFPSSPVDHVGIILRMLSYDQLLRPSSRKVMQSFGGTLACCREEAEPFAISKESEWGDVTLPTGGGDTLLESD